MSDPGASALALAQASGFDDPVGNLGRGWGAMLDMSPRDKATFWSGIVAGSVVGPKLTGLPGRVSGVASGAKIGGLGRRAAGLTEPVRLPTGSFSVVDMSTFPVPGLAPTGPLRMVDGAEYASARSAANAANRAIRRDAEAAGVSIKSMHVHEVQPVKFGGSPTDLGNKVLLPDQVHYQISGWWLHLQRNIERSGIGR